MADPAVKQSVDPMLALRKAKGIQRTPGDPTVAEVLSAVDVAEDAREMKGRIQRRVAGTPPTRKATRKAATRPVTR